MSMLRYQEAQNQVLRSLLLVQNGDIYCSSLFGSRNHVVSMILPEINNKRLASCWRLTIKVFVLWLQQDEIRQRAMHNKRQHRPEENPPA